MTIIGILGTIGNILSLIVLNRPAMKSGVNTLLISLAVFDTMTVSIYIHKKGHHRAHDNSEE